MKNKKIYIVFFVALFVFIFSIFDFKHQKKSSNIENSYPNQYIKFEEENVKLKLNEKAILHLQGGQKDKILYKVSDKSVIKIITSSEKGCIIKRIKNFEGEVKIYALFDGYEDVYSICYITCFNELIEMKNYYIYNEEFPYMPESSLSITNGIYYFEFDVKTLLNYSYIEEFSKKDILLNLNEIFKTEVEEITPKIGIIGFKIQINKEKVFEKGSSKTISFKVDQAYFIFTIYKAI